MVICGKKLNARATGNKLFFLYFGLTMVCFLRQVHVHFDLEMTFQNWHLMSLKEMYQIRKSSLLCYDVYENDDMSSLVSVYSIEIYSWHSWKHNTSAVSQSTYPLWVDIGCRLIFLACVSLYCLQMCSIFRWTTPLHSNMLHQSTFFLSMHVRFIPSIEVFNPVAGKPHVYGDVWSPKMKHNCHKIERYYKILFQNYNVLWLKSLHFWHNSSFSLVQV